jgi:hypothetical protein
VNGSAWKRLCGKMEATSRMGMLQILNCECTDDKTQNYFNSLIKTMQSPLYEMMQ